MSAVPLITIGLGWVWMLAVMDGAYVASVRTGPVSSLFGICFTAVFVSGTVCVQCSTSWNGPLRAEANAIGVVNTGSRTSELSSDLKSSMVWLLQQVIRSRSFLIFKLEMWDFVRIRRVITHKHLEECFPLRKHSTGISYHYYLRKVTKIKFQPGIESQLLSNVHSRPLLRAQRSGVGFAVRWLVQHTLTSAEVNTFYAEFSANTIKHPSFCRGFSNGLKHFGTLTISFSSYNSQGGKQIQGSICLYQCWSSKSCSY